MNGGEVEVPPAGKVDGFAMIQGVPNFWEFDGCWHHLCEKCYPSDSLPEDEQERQHRIKLRDEKKRAILRSCGVLHYTIECDWLSQNIHFQSRHFYLRNKITEADLLGPSFHGFIMATLFTPEDIKKSLSG